MLRLQVDEVKILSLFTLACQVFLKPLLFIQTSLLSVSLLLLRFLHSKFPKMKKTHPLIYIYICVCVCVCVCVELTNILPFLSERDLFLNLLMKSKKIFLPQTYLK